MSTEDKLAAIRRIVQEWEEQFEEDDRTGGSINPFYLIDDLYEVLNA